MLEYDFWTNELVYRDQAGMRRCGKYINALCLGNAGMRGHPLSLSR